MAALLIVRGTGLGSGSAGRGLPAPLRYVSPGLGASSGAEVLRRLAAAAAHGHPCPPACRGPSTKHGLTRTVRGGWFSTTTTLGFPHEGPGARLEFVRCAACRRSTPWVGCSWSMRRSPVPKWQPTLVCRELRPGRGRDFVPSRDGRQVTCRPAETSTGRFRFADCVGYRRNLIHQERSRDVAR
jgi:hypothetical protein